MELGILASICNIIGAEATVDMVDRGQTDRLADKRLQLLHGFVCRSHLLFLVATKLSLLPDLLPHSFPLVTQLALSLLILFLELVVVIGIGAIV